MQEWKECPSIFKVLKIKMTSNNNSKKHWFALKVFYNKVFAIEELLLKKKIKCYIPCETVKVLKQNGTKKKRTKTSYQFIAFLPFGNLHSKRDTEDLDR